jgi:hypothetical protein
VTDQLTAAPVVGDRWADIVAPGVYRGGVPHLPIEVTLS